MEIEDHFIRKLLAMKLFSAGYIPSEKEVVDLLTKRLPKAKFVFCAKSTGLQQLKCYFLCRDFYWRGSVRTLKL